MPLRFKNMDGKEGIFHYPGRPFHALIERFDQAIEDRDIGTFSSADYLRELELMITEEPTFIDAYAHIGNMYYEQGKPKKALSFYLDGISVGRRCIPEGYTGLIEWGHLDNRPFLRALNGAMLSYVRLHQHKNAVTMMEQLLTYDPDDHLGVRLLIASEYLRMNQRDLARPYLEREAPYYPPYWYELGLLHLEENDWVKAATVLRKGFLKNPYIAERLCGHPDPMPLQLIHFRPFQDQDTAGFYVSTYGRLWHYLTSYLQFLHWLYHHSQVLKERATYRACEEAISWETDGDERIATAHHAETILNQIDDRSTEGFVRKMVDRHGRSVYPWLNRNEFSRY